MNQFMKTSKCVICGEPATAWRGSVTAYRRMALGNMVPFGIAAGRCGKHEQTDMPENNSPWKTEYGVADTNLLGQPVYREEIFGE